MKFVKLLLLPIILILQVFSKKLRNKYDPMLSGVSQATRNYRKVHSDPSYNPLPHSYTTGPRNSFATHYSRKHMEYNSKLHHAHNYQDTTHVMAEKVHHMKLI